MRATTLIRAGSLLGSPRGALAARIRSDLLLQRSGCASALHLEAEDRRGGLPLLRRARSEANLVGPIRPFDPARVGEEADLEGLVEEDAAPTRPPAALVEEDAEYSGGGSGKGRKVNGGEGGDQNDNNRRIADYYQQMLGSDPSNPLLLRNYGKLLHEALGDAKGAEEYYWRATLANPGDGELLSLYGRLLWETHGDGERAEAYLERAAEASPDDCYVLASYAHFLWDAEEEEEQGM